MYILYVTGWNRSNHNSNNNNNDNNRNSNKLIAASATSTSWEKPACRAEFEVRRLRREHGQEVSGWVPPPGLVTSPWLPPSVQRDKHLPAAVLPAEGGVSVVAVLLYTLLELATRVILHLGSEEGAHAEVNAGRQRVVAWLLGSLGLVPAASNFTQHKKCCCSKIYSRCLHLIVAVLWILLHK